MLLQQSALGALLIVRNFIAEPCAAVQADLERSLVVDEINSKPGLLWRAGINLRFRGLPLGSAKALCGVRPGGKQRLHRLVSRGAVEYVPRSLARPFPGRFESQEHWPRCAAVIGNVRDQSACGCCWAFGAAEAASDRLCIYSNGTIAVPLSTEEVCFCGEADGCNGGTLELAWNYIQSTGLVTGTEYQNSGSFGSLGLCSSFSLPHCHHHGPRDVDPYPPVGSPHCPKVHHSPQCPKSCDAASHAPYNDFPNARYHFNGPLQYLDWDADLIASQIMLHGPVEAAFTVYEDFEHYLSGIYHATSSKELGDHAVKIVGWGLEAGVKYWRVLNSWNQYWGEDGYFRIRRGTNECGIEEQVLVSAAASTWEGPGITPAPPVPPVPGNCWQQETNQACQDTSQDGVSCEWCKHDSICQEAGSPCTPPIRNGVELQIV